MASESHQTVDREFFARDTLEVARELIGATLVHGACAGRIVETEAYRGDAASHFVTRPKTGRIMGETYGHLYVYSIYGVHRCLNVTTERGHPGAVLLRALEPLRGLDLMRRRRSAGPGRPQRPERELTSGPARLVQALAIDPRDSGRPFDEVLSIHLAAEPPEVVTGPRVGISKATDLPWRFMAARNPYVSRGGR